MSKEINPDNAKQMKDNGIVEIIHGGDKQEYTVTEKHPLIDGSKSILADPTVKAGQTRTAHPRLVKLWEDRGWVKATDKPIKKGIELPKSVEA